MKIFRYVYGRPEFVFLACAGFITRFWNLGFPDWVVFDEVHFASFAARYLSGEYFFDIHPPLGKLLFALFAWIGQVPAGFDFRGAESFEGISFIALRFLPALLGSLLIPLAYLIVRQLGFSKRASFLAGFFLLFENALLVESRFTLLDPILLFSIFSAVLFFVMARKQAVFSKKWYALYGLCGISLGAAISVKWVGFGVLGLLWLWSLAEDKFPFQKKKQFAIQFVLLALIPFVLYLAIFTAHFSVIGTDCGADCMSKAQNTSCAALDPNHSPVSLFAFEHCKMFLHNVYIQAEHPYHSAWYTWPLLARPIAYVIENQGVKTQYIYLMGNPVVWWGTSLALLALMYWALRTYIFPLREKAPAILYSKATMFLLLGYIVFLVPFASISRLMFLYHYFSSFVFAIMLGAVFVDGALSRFPTKTARVFLAGILLLVFAGFLLYLPLSYGISLSAGEFFFRMFLPTWQI